MKNYLDFKNFIKEKNIPNETPIFVIFRESAFSEIQYFQIVFKDGSIKAVDKEGLKKADVFVNTVEDVLNCINKSEEQERYIWECRKNREVPTLFRYHHIYERFNTCKEMKISSLERNRTTSFSSNSYPVKDFYYEDDKILLDVIF